MATLIDAAEFSANEIYEIQQTDAVEGAAVGASFGGIGISNEPHQQLANRTAFLKGRQDTNIANIAVLQAFAALFVGSMGSNGYLKVGFQDAVRGQIQAIVQWGTLSLLGAAPSSLKNTLLSQSFPIPFSTLCAGLVPYWQSNAPNGVAGAFVGGSVVLEASTPLSKTAASVFSDYDNVATINIASAINDSNGLTGIGWIAWGF